MVSTWAERKCTTTQRPPLSSPRRNGWSRRRASRRSLFAGWLMRSAQRPVRSTARSGPKDGVLAGTRDPRIRGPGRARRRSGCDRRSDYRPRASGRLRVSHLRPSAPRPLPRWVRGDFAGVWTEASRTDRAAWSDFVLRVRRLGDDALGDQAPEQLALRFNALCEGLAINELPGTLARPGLRRPSDQGAAGTPRRLVKRRQTSQTTVRILRQTPRDEVGYRLGVAVREARSGWCGRGGKRSIELFVCILLEAGRLDRPCQEPVMASMNQVAASAPCPSRTASVIDR